MTLISETVASSSSGVSFTSIAATFDQLILVWNGIYQDGSTSSFSIRLNADSGANYAMKNVEGSGTSFTTDMTNATSMRGTNTTSFGINVQDSTDYANMVAGYLIIDNYAGSKFKGINLVYSYQDATTALRSCRSVGTYKSTSAITSVDITRLTGTRVMDNAANTSIRLYGLA